MTPLSFFKSIAACFFTLFLLLVFSVETYSIVSNLIVNTIIYGLSLIVFLYNVPKINNTKKIIFTFFIVKIIFGILHYLVLVDPTFFNSDGSIFPYGNETDSIYSQVIETLSQKHIKGILYFNSEIFWATHPEFWNLFTILVYKTGLNALTIVPINSFFTSICSYCIISIAYYIYNFDKKRMNIVIWVFVLFPLFLQSDSFSRDQICISLIIICLLFFILIKNKYSILGCIAIVLVCISSYLLRTVYPLLFLLSLFASYAFSKKSRDITIALLVFASLFSFPIIYRIIQSEENLSYYVEGNKILSYTGLATLPVRLIVGIIGPFPWTQFMNYVVNRSLAFQLGNYLLGTLHLSLFIILIKHRKLIFQFVNFGILELYGFLLFSAAIFTSMMQINYVTVGIMLLSFLIIKYTTVDEIRKTFIFCFIVLLVLSSIGFILGGFGISSIWR